MPGAPSATSPATRACDPLDAVCDYLIADRGHTRILVTSMAEEDVQAIVRSPEVLVGSDGTSLAPYGTTSQGKPHPRFYGTFPGCSGATSAIWDCYPCPRPSTR